MEREDYEVFEIDSNNNVKKLDTVWLVHTKDGVCFRVYDAVYIASIGEQAMLISTQTDDKLIKALVYRYENGDLTVATGDISWSIIRRDA